jgi:hypothetical protein
MNRPAIKQLEMAANNLSLEDRAVFFAGLVGAMSTMLSDEDVAFCVRLASETLRTIKEGREEFKAKGVSSDVQ